MQKKPGFTLVELLVVISIIGVLVSLLLPAVQAAREAARKTQCTNNLKQLGLALHQYHNTHRTLPPAWVLSSAGVPGARNGIPYWGWSAMILPFLEQQNLSNSLNIGPTQLQTAVATPALQSVLRTPIAAFRCPSDNAPPINTRRLFSGRALASSNYVAASTSGSCNNCDSETNRDSDLVMLERSQRVQAGVFNENVGVRMADIVDGSSNVIALGERAWEWKDLTNQRRFSNAAVMFGIRTAGVGNNGRSDQTAQGAMRLNFDAAEPVDYVNGRSRRGFSSRHPSGALFVFADGSVHFLPETIDHDVDPVSQFQITNAVDSVYERLIARADGAPVTIPE